MSNSYYSDLWLVTEKDMENLLHLDKMAQAVKTPKPKNLALKTILPLYLNYRSLVRRLILCHDQIIEPQKRELIRKVLDCTIGRMLEYNREIVGLESNDYQWPDDLMIKMKMTPDDITTPVPTSYVADRKIFLQQRRAFIEDLIEKATKSTTVTIEDFSEDTENEETRESSDIIETPRESLSKPKRRRKTVQGINTETHVETPEEKAKREAEEIARKAFIAAILMIQSHERAREFRSIAARVEREYNYNKKLAMGQLEPRKASKKIKTKAALVVQRYWRGYITRKLLKQHTNQMDAMVDMTIPSWKDKEVFQVDEENLQRRISLRPQAVSMLDETTTNERARVFRIKGPGLMEDITDEIRAWFLLWYNELGYFDAYPIAEVGGTILVITGQTLTPEEFLIEKWEKDAQKGNKKKKESEAEATKKTKDDKAKKKPKGPGELEETEWIMPEESKAFSDLSLAQEEFVNNWRLKEETNNDFQKIYLDLIDEKMCHELQLEMREIVDELMRLELAKLNSALIKDHAGDEEKFVIPTMEKVKKGKQKGKKKKKGKADPLAAVPLENMFEELVLAKIIRNYPEEHLEKWQGDLSYQNYEAQLKLHEYQHRLGEIRQTILNYCVLPLGSREAHIVAPLVRSVCICGLPSYGKSFLANAICTEVGALLFDLSPNVIVGQYEGKKNQQKLMSMISKLGKEYPPAVVFVDGGEKPWMKKIPAADRYAKPKRLAKLLPKFVKSIKPGDQILLLGLATEPQKAKKTWFKIYNKFIIIPVTDYNTVYLYYKKLLMEYHGVDRNFNVSGLARMSVGYPLEFIREVIEKVMNLSRRITLKFKPLDSQEILDELMLYNGPNTKIVDQFKKFENQTPLGKTRAKIFEAMKEAQENPLGVKKPRK